MNQVLGVGWYRFRRTLRRRRGGYLGLVLMIVLIGGLAMASIAAARRTQSSYPVFLASTNPSDLSVSVYSAPSGAPGPSLTAAISHLPGVKRVGVVYALPFAPLNADGSPNLSESANVVMVGSLNDISVDQDLVTVTSGHKADPSKPDEIVMTSSAAQQLHARVGEILALGLSSPRFRLDAKVTGIVEFNNEIVQDDIDRAYGFVVFTPSLVREVGRLVAGGLRPANYALQLNHGSKDVVKVEQEIVRIIPRGYVYDFHVTSRVVSQVELAIKPESVALGAFGAIAALVCFVLAIQAISRQLGFDDEDRRTLRAFGANPAVTVGTSLFGVLVAVLAGVLLAFGLAVAAFTDCPLGSGSLCLSRQRLRVLTGQCSARAWPCSSSPWRRRRSCSRYEALLTGPPAAAEQTTRGSRIARSAESAGIPISGVIGVRLALEPGRGRTAVPVRSALFGTALAVSLVAATLTFASGFSTLISHPPLYGWNWTYALSPSNDVPPKVLSMLSHDPAVAAWQGFDYANIGIDGETVPVLLTTPRPSVSPPILSGHGLEADNQIVLGAATLSELHKRLGDTVLVGLGTPRDGAYYVRPTPVVIVGTATFPAIGFSSTAADHTSMGTGALVSEGIRSAFSKFVQNPDPNLSGPDLVFVRMRAGIATAPWSGRLTTDRLGGRQGARE